MTKFYFPINGKSFPLCVLHISHLFITYFTTLKSLCWKWVFWKMSFVVEPFAIRLNKFAYHGHWETNINFTVRSWNYTQAKHFIFEDLISYSCLNKLTIHAQVNLFQYSFVWSAVSFEIPLHKKRILICTCKIFELSSQRLTSRVNGLSMVNAIILIITCICNYDYIYTYYILHS